MTRNSETARTIERLPWRGNDPSLRPFAVNLSDEAVRPIRSWSRPETAALCPTLSEPATGSAWTWASDSAIIEIRNQCRKMDCGAGRSRLCPVPNSMQEYVVGKVDEIAEGKGIAVQAGRRDIAVFRAGGKLYAVANRCPHKGASLCEGEVLIEDGIVRCPWHHWNWKLRDG